FAVAPNLEPARVQDRESLLLVGLGVAIDLLPREHGPRRGATARIADSGGVVADDQDDGVPEVLELAELPENHGVPEVDVGRGGVDPELDAQAPAERQLALELTGRKRVDRVARKPGSSVRRRQGRARAHTWFGAVAPWGSIRPNARLSPATEAFAAASPL